MNKLGVLVPVAISVIAVTAIFYNVAFATGSAKSESDVSKLAIRVAEILGLDAAEVDEAITQAGKELRKEAVHKKLTTLVEKGKLTQEQMDKYLNRIETLPTGTPLGVEKNFVKKKLNKGPNDWGAIQKKRNSAVQKGDRTEQDVMNKLNWLKQNHKNKGKLKGGVSK